VLTFARIRSRERLVPPLLHGRFELQFLASRRGFVVVQIGE
jgi:hypothetical protein